MSIIREGQGGRYWLVVKKGASPITRSMFDGPSWPEAILVPSLSRLKKETVCTSMFMASVLCFGTSIKQVESTKVILRKVLIAKVVGRTQELTFAPVRCTTFFFFARE